MEIKVYEVPNVLLPRERLVAYGEKALSTHELLAILLRTGTKRQPVLELAQTFLDSFESMSEIKHASLDQLQTIDGIGPVKAIEIKAAIELGQRLTLSTMPKFGKLSSTRQAGEWLIEEMRDLHQEHLVVLFLNAKNEIIRKQTIFKGTVNSSVAHPREIFKAAVKYPTSSLIIAHNHPSGDTKPSIADIQFTRRMIECGELMGIEVLDHLIIGTTYNSLRESTTIFEE